MSVQPRIEFDELRRGLWLVEVFGEHDLAAVGLLDGALDHIAEVSETTAVVDLTDARFIDSTVIRTLIDQLRRHPEEDDDWIVVVARPGTEPRRALDIVRAVDALQVYDTREEALRAVTPLEAERAFHPWAIRSAVDRITAAFEARDSDRVAQLIHPEAALRPLALNGGVIHGRGGARDFIHVVRQGLAEVNLDTVEEVGSDAGILVGRYRHQRPDARLVDAQVVWAVAFRDGLMWRGKAVNTRAAAHTYLANVHAGH